MEETSKPKPPKSQLKEYDHAVMAAILRFLAVCLMASEHTGKQISLMAGDDAHLKMYARQLQYHANIQSGIRSMMHTATKRQRHLAEISDETINEVLARCNLPYKILSRPEESLVYVCSTIDSEKP